MLLWAQSWQQQWLQLRQHLWGLMMMQPLELLQVQSWHQLQEVEADLGGELHECSSDAAAGPVLAAAVAAAEAA